MRIKVFSNLFLLLMVFFLSIIGSVPVNADIITVTTSEDNVVGSLRQAITTTNTNGEDNVIYLPGGTYYLKGEADDDDNLSGDLDISVSEGRTLIIMGTARATTIIDGNQLDRVLQISSNGQVYIFNVTIRGGKTRDYPGGAPGDPDGGGIYNSGTLFLQNCVICNNATGKEGASGIDVGSPGGDGGGIYNDGYLEITDCRIDSNRTSDSNAGNLYGAPGGDGGGIMNYGRLTIRNTTVSNNTTGEGTAPGPENRGGHGGGIYSSGHIYIYNSTIAANRTGNGKSEGIDSVTYGGDGGGMYIEKRYAYLYISTVSGNSTGDGGGTASLKGGGGYGGGIAVNDGRLEIFDSTICSNFTGEGDVRDEPTKSTGYGGGIYSRYGSEVYMRNTIIANNQVPGNSQGPDYHGIFYSYNRNLIENIDNCIFEGDSENNITGVDPLLGPLQDNGGPTMTHALLANSPAIDAGFYEYDSIDQRGYIRPVDIPGIDNANEGLDIGAYEYDSSQGPVITVNRELLEFSADTSGNHSPGQTFTITNSGAGTMNWNSFEYDDWVSYSPASGTNGQTVTVTVDPADLAPGTYLGWIQISCYDALYWKRRVWIVLEVYDTNNGNPNVPFGVFKTPEHGSTVMSSVPVTGWALDDIGVTAVEIYRDPLPGEGTDKIYIGDAVFVEGARPDVEQLYPSYPNNHKAGWGYMMLTNFLPNSGNGTFTIYAIATDVEGNQVTLGTKTIICDNANAVKPIGAIDTPIQGGTASGSDFINFGWVLTPPPNSIPIDGSTIQVWVDGVSLGNPVYNRFREDIAALFPDYNNSSGAGGYFYLDTSQYENGVHTIQWTAADDAGNSDGIGSRYFSVQNPGNRQQANSSGILPDLTTIPPHDPGPVQITKGYDNNKSQEIYPGENGLINIKMKESDRLEINLEVGETPGSGSYWTGFHIIGSQWRPLPIGSFLDPDRGVFYWQLAAGFLGNYQLIFIKKDPYGNMTRQSLLVEIGPEFSD